MKRVIFLIIVGLFITSTLIQPPTHQKQTRFWQVQSIDTMKYSRDLAREKARDASFNLIIEQQIGHIAKTGATHVAIGTPYDEEFLPFLQRWVDAARRHNLHVWFRGNFAGWEQWFSYPKITRDQHKEKIKSFIIDNKDLFMDGDIFTACPECENGGPGDPRRTKDIAGHRQFLIEEFTITHDAFKKIGKKVDSNYTSMNADVARLVMDKKTTEALGNIVVIDHYVKDPQQLADDVTDIATQSGGKIVIGEFGVPVPDIHGNLSEDEQAQWLSDVVAKLVQSKDLIGMNYWVSEGGTTGLWNQNNTSRKAVSVMTQAYTPVVYTGYVKNTSYQPLADVAIRIGSSQTKTENDGFFSLPVFLQADITLEKKGYKVRTISGVKQDIGTIVL